MTRVSLPQALSVKRKIGLDWILDLSVAAVSVLSATLNVFWTKAASRFKFERELYELVQLCFYVKGKSQLLAQG